MYNKYKFKSVYLAGKIGRNDWRHTIVEGLGEIVVSEREDSWPILDNVIFDCLDYTGPYFSSGGHGAAHGEDSHGVFANLGDYDNHGCLVDYPRREWTVNCCKEAISQTDLVFAWIDDASCYGTLVELGYAKALNKLIWIAGPTRYHDLWFGYEMANELWFVDELDERLYSKFGAEDMLIFMLSHHGKKHYAFNSPIEQRFWSNWTRDSWIDLIPQYPIGKYRVDFANVETKTVIELDGLKSHSSTEDIAKDRKRQREIEALGWHVIRFGGKEIHNNVSQCVDEAHKIISQRDTNGSTKPF